MVDYRSIDQTSAQRIFHTYVQERQTDKLRNLLAARSDIDLDAPDTALDQPVPAVMSLCVRPDAAAVLELLLDYGADPDAGKRYPCSPVTHASANAEVDNLRLLVAAGADVMANDRDGENAYTSVDIFHDRSPELLSVLYNLGFDANASVGRDDETILFSLNNDDMFASLQVAMTAGADPIFPNESGTTALEQAGVRGEERAEALLAKYAAMPRMKDEKSYTEEELFRTRSNGNRMVDNPFNWNCRMQGALDSLQTNAAPPNREMLLTPNAEGRTAMQTAFEARRGDLAMQCLRANGEYLQSQDLYDEGRKPTALLQTMCETGQAGLLFEPEMAKNYSRELLTDVHARMPIESKANISIFSVMVMRDNAQSQHMNREGR